jgi:hypothetical protein
MSLDILDARISLSPNFISSVEVVSFSLIIGIHLKLIRFSIVAMAFLEDFLFSASEGDNKI